MRGKTPAICRGPRPLPRKRMSKGAWASMVPEAEQGTGTAKVDSWNLEQRQGT